MLSPGFEILMIHDKISNGINLNSLKAHGLEAPVTYRRSPKWGHLDGIVYKRGQLNGVTYMSVS